METTTALPARSARCTCGLIVSSSPDLAFFEDTRPGNRSDMCTCGWVRHAHLPTAPAQQDGRSCQSFALAASQLFDRFYCGCRGWD